MTTNFLHKFIEVMDIKDYYFYVMPGNVQDGKFR